MFRGDQIYWKVVLCLGLLLFILFLRNISRVPDSDSGGSLLLPYEKYMIGEDKKVYRYHREMPLIFIGGVPRSGTTLMRVMLDAHPEVRCGQETHVIPAILKVRDEWMHNQFQSRRIKEAGITMDALDAAIAEFCLEVIVRHGDPAPRLCNKDPLTLKHAAYLTHIFPGSKFIFMVRDGRATVHSMIMREVTVLGFDPKSPRQNLEKWSQAIYAMHMQCLHVGPERCMLVYYEQLVLHPSDTMHHILEFLEIPWNESVLHHDDLINKPGGVTLSKTEPSTDQVMKPVNLEALTRWVGHFPDDVVRDMAEIAPMLAALGYDPAANPPNYGSPDAFVRDNTRRVKADKLLWEQKADAFVIRHSNRIQQPFLPVAPE